LYESLREAYRDRIDENLRATQGLLEQGFKQQAKAVAESAGEGITELKDSVEEAASSVLRNETEGLRRALAELDTLTKQLQDEMEANREGQPGDNERSAADQPDESPEEVERLDRELQEALDELNRERSGETTGENRTAANEPAEGDGENARPGDGSQAESESSGQPSESSRRPSESSGQPGDGQEGAPSSPGSDRRLAEQSESADGTGANDPAGEARPGNESRNGQRSARGGLRGGNRTDGGGTLTGPDRWGNPFDGAELPAPLTGEGFRDWSDRLRDVEEMVEDPQIRNRAAGIRERARDVRRDYQRHSKKPEWSLVEDMIARPLRELRQHVAEELLRRSAEKNAVVPIDRDPVPDRYAEQVRRYYEQLGSQE
jgi:hypothetical protein